MTAQHTAKLLLDWWNLTGKRGFLDYAIKTVALFDREGRRMEFEGQCIKYKPRNQIVDKRYPDIVVDIQDGWFDQDGKWIGKEYDELCLEEIHSALLKTYGLK